MPMSRQLALCNFSAHELWRDLAWCSLVEIVSLHFNLHGTYLQCLQQRFFYTVAVRHSANAGWSLHISTNPTLPSQQGEAKNRTKQNPWSTGTRVLKSNPNRGFEYLEPEIFLPPWSNGNKFFAIPEVNIVHAIIPWATTFELTSWQRCIRVGSLKFVAMSLTPWLRIPMQDWCFTAS
jgi:hypothetical protein